MRRFVAVKTPLPGPRSRQVLERLGKIVPRAFSPLHPVVAASACGALVEDVDGNVFLDFAGGIGCLNAGHSNPGVVAAIQGQAGRFTHTDFSVVPYELYAEVAERLARHAPVAGPAKAAFFNSGAEAVENAVKIARAATGRRALIAFDGAFHGRTYMALGLTSRVDPYKQGFGPFPGEIYRVPFPDPYRADDPARCGQQALAALEEAFVTRVPAGEVAAVVVEPVLGEGGFIVPPPGFLPDLAALCRRHGILVVADEIQTGLGRSGRFFASEALALVPDLLTSGKSLAAGLPLSAVVGRADLMDAPGEGALGGTTIANPVALAAAREVLDTLERDGLPARAQALGERALARLKPLEDRCQRVGQVRGLGALVAVELVEDKASKGPAPALTGAVLRECLHRGLILVPAGVHRNVIRLLFPLVIGEDELDEGLAILGEVLVELAGPSA